MMNILVLNRKEALDKNNYSSAGVIPMLVKSFIDDYSAVIYGAAYTNDFHAVEHIRITTFDEYNTKIAGSKYVQSNLNGCFIKIKADLKAKKFVCFIGTPCQNQALKIYLKRDYKNLFQISIACNSVVLPKYFDEYITQKEEEYQSKVKSINMRDKSISWQNYGMKIEFQNGKSYFNEKISDPYLVDFINHKNIAERCKGCKMRVPYSADIVVGDFWGVFQVHKSFLNKDGTSLCILANKKAEKEFDKVKDQFIFAQANQYQIMLGQTGVRFKTANIVTYLFDNDYNFGQKLQAYAVQKVCEKCFVIPFTYHYILVQNSINTEFQRTYMNLINKNPDPLDSPDYFIAGSDQIWNQIWLKYNDLYKDYLLSFTNSPNKIAFATSFGPSAYFSSERKEAFMTELPKFKFISCRERAGVNLLKNHKINAEFILDPVAFLTAEDWSGIEKMPNWINENINFTFEYNLRSENFSKRTKYIIVNWNQIITGDPAEFIWLIHHCKELITDSFHGTLLGIIFKKPIICYDPDVFKNDDRFAVFNEIGFKYGREQDWDLIHKNFNSFKQRSYALIESAFN